jgi:DNA (cytosine-5)-methyltransferase 1
MWTNWDGAQTAPTLTMNNAGGAQRMPDKGNFNAVTNDVTYIVRRLTPTECARLQGFPDWWCADVPHTDSAEYKLWGNGVALPCVLYVMEGIAEILKNEKGEKK